MKNLFEDLMLALYLDLKVIARNPAFSVVRQDNSVVVYEVQGNGSQLMAFAFTIENIAESGKPSVHCYNVLTEEGWVIPQHKLHYELVSLGLLPDKTPLQVLDTWIAILVIAVLLAAWWAAYHYPAK